MSFFSSFLCTFFRKRELPSTSHTGSFINSNPIGQKNDGDAVCGSLGIVHGQIQSCVIKKNEAQLD